MATVNSPKEISETGERLYREKYQREYEGKFPGQYVAINVKTGSAVVRERAEEAMLDARKDDPVGIFHLIKIGSPGAFQLGFADSYEPSNWLFR